MATLMPPADLRAQTAGTDNIEWFHASGRITCDVWNAALVSVGHQLSDFGTVLDFGCGPGRVLRWLQARFPRARFVACDNDPAAIAWIRTHYPSVEVVTTATDGLPPMPVERDAIDLVLAFSVFTHLDVPYQDAWLSELQRVLRPGGFLLASISGPRMLHHTRYRSGHGNLDELERQLPALATDGVVHWRGDGWERAFPDYYHTTFHTHDYIRRHWSSWFDVLAIDDDTPEVLPQDVVVLRHR
jgi:SAM-dependent methyltransferase